MNDILLTAIGVAGFGWIIAIQLPVSILKNKLVLDMAWGITTIWFSASIGGQQLAIAALIGGVLFSILLHSTSWLVVKMKTH